jgi:CubicO group peptidase (beta-lactamase class C family)
VERITGQRLCDYAKANIFDRLGLRHTCYFPLDSVSLLSRDTALVRLCAPTEVLKDGHTLKAEVHDPTARLVNMGNSGNAGVFSNMEDLSVICSALMNGGSWNGKRILSPLTVKRMFTVPKDNDPKVGRALGWDAYDLSPYLCGDVFNTSTTRGHTGYTGTSVLLDLETKTAVIILSNRVHPSDIGSLSRMRSTIASIVGSSILD